MAEDVLSVRKQCELAGVSRSSWYYEPVSESDENLMYMRLLDGYFRFYNTQRPPQALGYQMPQAVFATASAVL